MLTTIASSVSGVIGVGILFIDARLLLAPQVTAAGYGVPLEPPGAQTPTGSPHPWLYVKGVRDIASGIFLFILLVHGGPRLLGAFMAASSALLVA